MHIQCIIVVQCKVIGNTVLPHIHPDRVKSTPRFAMYLYSFGCQFATEREFSFIRVPDHRGRAIKRGNSAMRWNLIPLPNETRISWNTISR